MYALNTHTPTKTCAGVHAIAEVAAMSDMRDPMLPVREVVQTALPQPACREHGAA